MIEIKRAELKARLPWTALTEAIGQKLLEDDVSGPQRMAFDIEGGSQKGGGTLLVMPAWRGSRVIGIKTVTFWPDNRERGMASHGANYILMDARTGDILAVLDGEELTQRRTAAVSVLAGRFLLRSDVERLLVVGTGPIAANLVRAHHASGRFSRIDVYGRTLSRANDLVKRLEAEGIKCSVCENIEAGVRGADMIATATSAREKLFDGTWVQPGTHVDLIGSFHPEMRESDDHLIARANAIWVDTAAAITEAGDLTQPIAAGLLSARDIAGDLRALVQRATRRTTEEITLFKAVGFSLPDLVAAEFALDHSRCGVLTAAS